jgi:NADH oxidoreductase Hcr
VRRHPQIRVAFAATGRGSVDGAYPGRIDEALLSTVPDLAHAIALVCGPQDMIAGLTALLARMGVPPPQIRFERFDAAVAAASRPSEAAASPRRRAAACFRMRAARSGCDVEIAAGQTLLEAAEGHGLEIPSICRAGVCGTCRTRVLEGDVECTSALIDGDDRRNGYVLACVSSPRSDCVIEV